MPPPWLDRERRTLLWELDVASSAKAYDVKLNRARQGREAEARLVTASATEYDLKINARTGKVVGRKVDD